MKQAVEIYKGHLIIIQTELGCLYRGIVMGESAKNKMRSEKLFTTMQEALADSKEVISKLTFSQSKVYY